MSRGSSGTYCFAFSFIKQKTIIIGRELQQSVNVHDIRGFARKSTLLTSDGSLCVHRNLIRDIDTLFSQLYIMYMVFALERHKQVYNRNVYQKYVPLLQGTMEQDKLHFFFTCKQHTIYIYIMTLILLPHICKLCLQ